MSVEQEVQEVQTPQAYDYAYFNKLGEIINQIDKTLKEDDQCRKEIDDVITKTAAILKRITWWNFLSHRRLYKEATAVYSKVPHLRVQDSKTGKVIFELIKCYNKIATERNKSYPNKVPIQLLSNQFPAAYRD